MSDSSESMGVAVPARAASLRPQPATLSSQSGITNAWRAIRRLDPHYWFRSRFIPSRRYHVINTGLPPGWHDVDDRMLYGCMALLCSYVEDEQGGVDNFPGFAVGDPATDTEALTIYRWWKEQRPADREREEALLMAWHGGPGTEDAFREHGEMEAANDARDQEMLHRLIDIRRSLWT